MSSVQRRRGQEITFWPEKLVENTATGPAGMLVADMDADPYVIKAAIVPVRSSAAELPGQIEISTYSVIMDNDLVGVSLYSRAYWREVYWDISSPPLYHHGTRATRHWTVEIRLRNSDG